MATPREQMREAFAATAGWSGATATALPADASFRRYFRLQRDRESCLIMDAPPDQEDVRPFVLIARHLAKLGLSTPRIWAADEANGFLLLEDFGQATFTQLLRDGGDETRLMEAAVDTIIHLHQCAAAADIAVPDYSVEILCEEALLFPDWFVPAYYGEPCTPAARDAYIGAWTRTFASMPPAPVSLVLRDYHVDNLMLLAARSGVRRCGLLDFQDALIGPVAYDLVSLVEDARRAIPASLRSALIDRYCRAFPQMDAALIRDWCAVLGAQRHAKVGGLFIRLHERDAKRVYLRHIPQVLGLLRGRLAHPALVLLKAWFEQHAPRFEQARFEQAHFE
ncbi:MAG: phosphotransferase [Gammaproteobacteria bacterium]|nr:phosphotransferase [Gammaproteobacteria bacterium]